MSKKDQNESRPRPAAAKNAVDKPLTPLPASAGFDIHSAESAAQLDLELLEILNRLRGFKKGKGSAFHFTMPLVNEAATC